MTSVALAGQTVYITDGRGRVFYSVCQQPSVVVKAALKMFEGDMQAVTGVPARNKQSGAPLQVYQLDQLSNKEFKAVEKLGLPLHEIITKHEAYYIGTRNNKVIVVGSDARGTAYGILRLSEMAGVSPWREWSGAQPQPRKAIGLTAGFECRESPATAYRALSLETQKTKRKNVDSQLARLMLRLRLNTLWQGKAGKHAYEMDNSVADSFMICHGSGYRVSEIAGKHHKHHKTTVDEVCQLFKGSGLSLGSTSPGYVVSELTAAASAAEPAKHSKHSSKKADRQQTAWVASAALAHLPAYQLSLYADLVWQPSVSLTTYSIAQQNDKAGLNAHLQQWLSALFGESVGTALLPVMQEFYRLTSICQPAFIGQDFGDMAFHSGEFGNELERYLYAFDKLRAEATRLKRYVAGSQQPAYDALVVTPIFAASYMAEKELEAQEARHIARPGLFKQDAEAQAAAALSLRAYSRLRALPGYEAATPPTLPGSLTPKEVNALAEEAFDRQHDLRPLALSRQDIVAKNCADWTAVATAAGSAQPSIVPLLGHSNKAVVLPVGTSLRYTVRCPQSGDVRFTLAALPALGTTDTGTARVSVSIDGRSPVTCNLSPATLSKDYETAVSRGQLLRSFYTTLSKGRHTVEIKAVEGRAVVDQWIIDYDVDRAYYVIPTDK